MLKEPFHKKKVLLQNARQNNRVTDHTVTVSIGGCEIERVRVIRYLGIMIDDKLK